MSTFKAPLTVLRKDMTQTLSIIDYPQLARTGCRQQMVIGSVVLQITEIKEHLMVEL